jgi:hypothetical protein
MTPRRGALALLGALACCAAAGGVAGAEEDAGLRKHLTEREDKRRPREPWRIDVAGRPLTLGGEYATELGYLYQRGVAAPARPDRLALGNQLELEAFYSFGPPLSLFVQFAAVWEEDLIESPAADVSTVFFERGEMWLHSDDIAGTHVNFEVGRLDFEDERRWWWDDELDAVRVEYEREHYEISLALGQELGSERSDLDEIEPDAEGITRVLGEASWDWSENHGIELFFLYGNDHSKAETRGDLVRVGREDESDGRLTWLGARAMGAIERARFGIFGYWLDTGWVHGRERLLEFEYGEHGQSVALETDEHDVSGWAVDAGVSWGLPLRFEPRVFAGFAFGSGDPEGSGGTDHSYQQTDLQSNEAAFGGVQRFRHYGVLLDPELSNLAIVTIGGGLSLFQSSSLDLVYHHYRLDRRAGSMRQARIETPLTGVNRTLGDEIDLVVAIEEWERLEFDVAAAAFRAGRAFGQQDGAWSFGAFLGVRVGF